MSLEPHCVILYPDQLTCPTLAIAPAIDWVGGFVMAATLLVVAWHFWRRRAK